EGIAYPSWIEGGDGYWDGRRYPPSSWSTGQVSRNGPSCPFPVTSPGVSMSLKNKVAIVTGGNSGIGMAIALELARQGANIVIDYVVHPEATEALQKQIIALGDRAIGVKADVSQVTELQTLLATAVKEFGRVDIMVNNAGV